MRLGLGTFRNQRGDGETGTCGSEKFRHETFPSFVALRPPAGMSVIIKTSALRQARRRNHYLRPDCSRRGGERGSHFPSLTSTRGSLSGIKSTFMIQTNWLQSVFPVAGKLLGWLLM